MAISVALNVSPAAPNHGDTVTATYVVSGNAGNPATDADVTGDATVGGTDFPVSAVVTIPATAPLAETFAVPLCADLTFAATTDPATFTALVP